MEGAYNAVRIYRNSNNIVDFTGFLYEAQASHFIENRFKKLYNSSTKTKK